MMIEDYYRFCKARISRAGCSWELHEFSDKSIIKSLFRHEITILLKLSQKRAMLFPQSSLTFMGTSFYFISSNVLMYARCAQGTKKWKKQSARKKREDFYVAMNEETKWNGQVMWTVREIISSNKPIIMCVPYFKT